MKNILIPFVAVVALTMIACEETTPVDPGPVESAQMSFKNGARYQYNSYSTDPETGAKQGLTERTRTLTLVQSNATVQSKGGVALYVDSIFNLGGIVDLTDSVYLRQEPGTNQVYRYASLAPELDFSGFDVVDLDADWMYEARLNASSASWFVGRAQDTVDYDPGITGVTVDGLEVAVTDSAVASVVETVTIGGTEYKTTKTTHKLILSINVIGKIGPIPASIPVKTFSLERVSWVSHELGAIVREEREGTVIDAELDFSGQKQGISIPIPGYKLTMTSVLSTGG